MARKAFLLVVFIAFVGAIEADEEPVRDIVPIMPIGQVRLFDTRYYGGSQDAPFALSPDGKYAVGNAGSNQLMVYELGKSIQNRQQGRPLQTDNPNFYRPALAFAPDAKTLAGMSNNFPDMNVHFWDVTTGREIRQIDNDQPFQSLALSPDGKLLALGTSQRVEIWDAQTADDVRTLTGGAPGSPGYAYQALAFSADGRMLAGGSMDTIRVWEIASGQERVMVKLGGAVSAQAREFVVYRGGRPSTGVSALAISADGGILAAAGTDQAIRLWNLRTGQELPPLVGHHAHVSALVFTPDGRRLMSLDGSGLKLDWDARRLASVASVKLRPPTDNEMEDLWDALGDADAFQAFRTARLMAADPARALALLKQRLQPVPPGDANTINKLVADLQNPNGAVRRKAMAALRNHGEAALGALIKAAPNNPGFNQNVSLMINRLESLGSSRDRQQAVKAVQVLEQIGNAEAKDLLDKLSKGAAGAPLTSAAQASLDRLKAGAAQANEVDRKALWNDLAADAKKSFAAIGLLTIQSDKAVSILREHLKPAVQPKAKHVEDLLAGLEDPIFAVRQKATTELEKLGELAVPVLQKASAKGLSLEGKQRVDQLLGKLDPSKLSANHLQQLRALEALEHIGSAEAQALLKELAQGAPAARTTREAQACLERLQKRSR